MGTLGCLPLKTSSGSALTFQGIISNAGEIAAEYFMRSSARRMYPSVAAAVAEVGGWQSGRRRRRRDPRWPTWTFEARLVCTVPLYVSVRGDSTLKSNYTTITGSLIKLRATGLIQPCDPAERAHSSLHCSDIIQSVLQRRTC